MVGFWSSTAAFVFTHCLGTSPGRYGHPIEEQGKGCGSILQPPGSSTLGAKCGGSPPVSPHHATPALREAPAGGGGLERRPVPVPQGQAVTAGRGPQCHTKAASRRFLPQAYRRPGPFFFGVKARFFFRRKRNGLSPRRESGPCKVEPCPPRAATGRPYTGGWRAGVVAPHKKAAACLRPIFPPGYGRPPPPPARRAGPPRSR